MLLKIMTYNIHRGIGVDRRFNKDRLVEIIAHHQPDITLLQESLAGGPQKKDQNLTRELATALGFPHYAVGTNVDWRRGRWGNATLSRHPILLKRNIDLTVESHKQRGCQHTKVRVEDDAGGSRDLDVFNLHLGLSAKERARQVGILCRSEEFDSCDRRKPCIVGGDFNDWRSLLHPIFTEILGFSCATQKDVGYDTGLRTYPSVAPRGGLDRLYFRGPLSKVSARTCRLALSRVASDHLPVIVELELE